MYQVTRDSLKAGLLTVIASAAGAAHSPAAPIPQDPTAKAILAELLAIDTTYEKGTVAAVEALRKRFLAAGFSDADLVVESYPQNRSQTSLIVRMKGRGAGKPLLYLCHLDVVAAKPADWTVPPFALTEKDGWIYGRGSLDMKGEDANVAAALLRLKRESYVPARDIIVAFTPDEESNGKAGVGFLVKDHRDLIDAGLVLNPDSGTGAFRRGRGVGLEVHAHSGHAELRCDLELLRSRRHASAWPGRAHQGRALRGGRRVCLPADEGVQWRRGTLTMGHFRWPMGPPGRVFTIIPPISLTSFAATTAVRLEMSQRGLNSTMSAPTRGCSII